MFRDRWLTALLTRPRLSSAFVVILLLLFATHAALNARAGDLGDFGDFYQAAQALTFHQDIYAETAGRYIYPPFFAFVMQPLTLFSEPVAAAIWIVLNGLFILAAIIVASREAALRLLADRRSALTGAAWVIAAGAAALASDKIHGVFTLGQTDGLILLAFACVLRWLDRHPYLAGLAVGASGCVKYLSFIFVPYFIMTRRYRAALASGLSFVLFLALPSLQLGFKPVVTYTLSAFSGLGAMTHTVAVSPALKIHPLTWDRSVSLTSAIFRLTRGHGWPDFVPLLLIFALGVMVIAGAIAICRRHGVTLFLPSPDNLDARSSATISLEWATLIIVALTFSPQTTSRHMVLLLPVYSVAVTVLLHAELAARRWLIASLILMVVGLSLPLRGLGFNHQLHNWRAIAGPSWCACVLLFTLLQCGSRMIGPTTEIALGESRT